MFDGLQRLLKVAKLKSEIEDVTCGICKKIMIDACQILCGCRFCRHCIQSYLTEGGQKCPIYDNEECRKINLKSMGDVHSEVETNRAILRLIITCPIKGCKVEGEILNMITHLDECRTINGDDITQQNEEIQENYSLRTIVNLLEKKVEKQFEDINDLIQQMNIRMNKAEVMINNETVRINSVNVMISNIERMLNEERNDDFIWKITDFSQKKNKKTHLYSDSFYSRKYGYKLILLCYPNGDDGVNQYLSLYFKILKGEYDDILPWPFKYNVTLSILDQEGLSRDFSSVINYQPSSSYQNIYDKPLESENRSHGKSQFISFSSLESQPYLMKNDNLYLKLSLRKTTGYERRSLRVTVNRGLNNVL